MPVDVLRFSMSDIIKHADDGTLGVLAEQIAQRLRPDDDPDGTPTLSGSLKTLESTLPDLCTAAKRADIAAEALIEYPTPDRDFGLMSCSSEAGRAGAGRSQLPPCL